MGTKYPVLSAREIVSALHLRLFEIIELFPLTKFS